jgi:hypothetical protein
VHEYMNILCIHSNFHEHLTLVAFNQYLFSFGRIQHLSLLIFFYIFKLGLQHICLK